MRWLVAGVERRAAHAHGLGRLEPPAATCLGEEASTSIIRSAGHARDFARRSAHEQDGRPVVRDSPRPGALNRLDVARGSVAPFLGRADGSQEQPDRRRQRRAAGARPRALDGLGRPRRRRARRLRCVRALRLGRWRCLDDRFASLMRLYDRFASLCLLAEARERCMRLRRCNRKCCIILSGHTCSNEHATYYRQAPHLSGHLAWRPNEIVTLGC